MKNLKRYGKNPFNITVIHGGPGAPGEMAPVAKELSKSFGVLEPWQTADSITGQIEELKIVLEKNADLPAILVGHSWGAMLAFIFTAQYPALVKKLIMVSSGAFTAEDAKNIMKTRLSRLSKTEQVELQSLLTRLENPNEKHQDEIFAKLGQYSFKTDSYDATPHVGEKIPFQFHIFNSVWTEAEKLRSSGELLALGKKIQCPVVAIHGDSDPHPPKGVEVPLKTVLKDFRFILLPKCGHYPWLEKHAKAEFYRTLRDEVLGGT